MDVQDGRGETARLGVVIPALDEAARLPALLGDLTRLRLPNRVVVADGGSQDRTREVARELGATVVTAPRGRAPQMNAGARAAGATGWLCFLHADVRLPERALRELERAAAGSPAGAAVFRLAIDAPGAWFRVLELAALLRDRLLGLPYGDQGLLVDRRLFQRVGGFPDIPIMEDVAMVRALRRRGPVRRLPAAVRVSDRRWRREGRVRRPLINAGLVAAYLAGVSPARLARWYRPEPG